MFFSPTFKNFKKKRKEEQHPPTKTSKRRWLFWNPRKWGGVVRTMESHQTKTWWFSCFFRWWRKVRWKNWHRRAENVSGKWDVPGNNAFGKTQERKVFSVETFLGETFGCPLLKNIFLFVWKLPYLKQKTAKNPGASKKLLKEWLTHLANG